MLVWIGMTPPTKTTTRLRRLRGAEADGLSHKKVHRGRQQKNIDNDNLPTTKTSTTMLVYQQRKCPQDAGGDNVNN